VLYERYLTPLGLIQAGFLYKDITAPIVSNVVLACACYNGTVCGSLCWSGEEDLNLLLPGPEPDSKAWLLLNELHPRG
jgi:hypothetical protein